MASRPVSAARPAGQAQPVTTSSGNGEDNGGVLVKRPAFGTKGIPFRVKTNFFHMNNVPTGIIYHWEVGVTTPAGLEVKDQSTCRKALQVYSEQPSSPLSKKTYVFDGMHILYTAKNFPQQRYSAEVEWAENSSRAKNGKRNLFVELQYVADVDFRELAKAINGKSLEIPQNCIQTLNIILAHHPSASHFTVGKAFYPLRDPESTFTLARSHVELHVGYRTSVRTSAGRVMLNLDVANTLTYKPGPLIDFCARAAQTRIEPNTVLSPVARSRITSAIIGLKVSSSNGHPDVPTLKENGEAKLWSWKIFGISKDPVSKTTFKLQDGKEVTVASYFEQKYGVKIRYPNLPCFNADKNKAEPKYIPLEFAIVDEKQLFRKTLEGPQSREMIDITCQPPAKRAQKIMDAFERIRSPDSILNEFSINVNGDMMKVDARMLQPPKLKYGSTSKQPEVVPGEGAWNLRDKKMFLGTELKSWAVICFGDKQRTYPPQNVDRFVAEMGKTCQATGMNVAMRDPLVIWEPGAARDPEEVGIAIGNAIKNSKIKPQIIMCLLPAVGADPVYNAIKLYADTITGIQTTCIAQKHVQKAAVQYCANVCMKLNLKLGGITVELSAKPTWVSSAPTMILGADVTHPTFGDRTMPSIAAVVGTLNAACSAFKSSIKIQDARMETLTSLTEQMIEIFTAFVKKNGRGPARILFYRDGVSEGEFEPVSRTEINAIRAAAEKMRAGWRPQITYVACQKRHNARFFPDFAAGQGGGGGPARGGFGGGRGGGRGGGAAGRGGGGGGISYPYDNVPPGTVVDSGITHPSLFDFFLVSHAGLKGTSRPVHYQVLRNECKLNQDELQALSYELCHLYGKATRAVSVVTPVYYAHTVAARARCWFAATRGDIGMSPSPTDIRESLGVGQGGGKLPKLHPDLENTLWFM
ncbi:Piwi domain-containing protein [Fimicolochytrium jonesii]|uniref:Piwi domain-containing protein n=1 Tax=Fimicolochytrium jonesii TaxID=1396493 RepID=UPI0022FE8919|nr:Piwi domain-containing protein [Fimicolochytrium jonesii]KAI8820684.1 Piwi domain-containing protein [Fimicolochytrium jonesii]